MATVKETKATLKEMATKIREMKSTRKQVPFGYVPGLDSLRREYRYLHIAYCMKRGTHISVIENPANDNQVYMPAIEKLIAGIEFAVKIVPEVSDVENVCHCA